jgi:anaerobic ribonucleoside-triphosphate reductase
MKVRKRNGVEQDFDIEKIKKAVNKANVTVEKEVQLTEEQITEVAETAKEFLKGFNIVKVQQVQDAVEKALMNHNHYEVAKSYVIYRDEHLKNKKFTQDEEKALAICSATSEDVSGDNANKRATVLGTMRDYLAGLVCKSIGRKILPKEVQVAHDQGMIHFHDMDYSPLMPISNCCLVNTFDMFKNGFQMNDTWIDPPHSFLTGANLQAQINLIISGSQYGGQTVSWAALAPFVDVSRQRIKAKYKKLFEELGIDDKKKFNEIVEREVRKEVEKGVETYQYQCISHTSSNGQSPFVSAVLNLLEAKTKQEQKDLALIIEKVFKERIKGVKNKDRRYTAPLFPKLIYFTSDGLNLKPGDPYYYLTELAAKCNVYRMQPDYVSEKKCRENKEGMIIAPMGCRSFLVPYRHIVQYAEAKTISPTMKFNILNVDKQITTKQLWEEYLKEGFIPDENNKIYPYMVCTSFGLIDYLQKKDDGVYIYTKGLLKLKDGKPIDWELGINYEILDEPNKDYICLSLNPKSIKDIPVGDYEDYKIVYNFQGNTGYIIKKEANIITCVEPKTYGRWNRGVVTINIPHAALRSKKEGRDFFEVLNEYAEIAHKGLLIRNDSVKRIRAKNAPILWMFGGLSRLDGDDDLSSMLNDLDYTTISLGYIGLYETCMALIEKSNTTPEGQELSIKILEFLNKKCVEWKEQDKIPYSIYGTPEEALTEKAAQALKRDFGTDIYGVTDHDYVTNSYHVNPAEKITAFDKLALEGKYLALSKGGAVSYVEATNLENNISGIIAVVQFMYDNILYAEINTKIDYCYNCGYDGELVLDSSHGGKLLFHCPQCGCCRQNLLSAVRRTCGYMGEAASGISSNSPNMLQGRLADISARYVHMQ